MSEAIESKIWVFVEQRQGRLAEVSLELIGKALALAEPLGWPVAAVLLGRQVEPLVERVLAAGPAEVLLIEDPLLADYCNQAYAKALAGAIGPARPEVFLLGATALGADLGPRLAARLRTGLSAHCLDLELTPEGELLAVVPGWGGNFLARISCPKTRPQMATVRPGLFPVLQAGPAKGRVIRLAAELDPSDLTYRIKAVEREEIRESGLETAEVVVAGGWGIGGPEDWSCLEELAAALGGAVGATRPPVDEGWAQEHQLIGTSGRTVKPKLYIGVALSGHLHHLVGLKNPGLSVAINQDPQAPIFEHADLGLVGDFREIVPALIEAIKSH